MEHVQIEPGSRAVALTPSDIDPINVTTKNAAGGPIPYARALRLLTDGNVSLVTLGGDTCNYTGLTAGTRIDWVSVRQLRNTGTTASVEALY